MAQWGNTDNAANSVFWVGSLVKTTANVATRNALFGNTTANAFIQDIATGQFGVDVNEMKVARETGNTKPAHAGWILRTQGTGGRAGRVQQEVLVAMSTITGDAADDTVLPDFGITITSQPANTTVTAGNNAIFTVAAATVPAGGTLTFGWRYANGSNIPVGAVVGNTTTNTLTVNTAVQTANASFRVTVNGTGGAAPVTSETATLTILP